MKQRVTPEGMSAYCLMSSGPPRNVLQRGAVMTCYHTWSGRHTYRNVQGLLRVGRTHSCARHRNGKHVCECGAEDTITEDEE